MLALLQELSPVLPHSYEVGSYRHVTDKEPEQGFKLQCDLVDALQSWA